MVDGKRPVWTVQLGKDAGRSRVPGIGAATHATPGARDADPIALGHLVVLTQTNPRSERLTEYRARKVSVIRGPDETRFAA